MAFSVQYPNLARSMGEGVALGATMDESMQRRYEAARARLEDERLARMRRQLGEQGIAGLEGFDRAFGATAAPAAGPNIPQVRAPQTGAPQAGIDVSGLPWPIGPAPQVQDNLPEVNVNQDYTSQRDPRLPIVSSMLPSAGSRSEVAVRRNPDGSLPLIRDGRLNLHFRQVGDEVDVTNPVRTPQKNFGRVPQSQAPTGDVTALVQSLIPGAQVSSTRRTPEHNAEVGGVANSMHLTGEAADIVLPQGVAADNNLRARLEQGLGVRLTEFIPEGDHLHIGWGQGEGAPNIQTASTEPQTAFAWQQHTQSGGQLTGRALQQAEYLMGMYRDQAETMFAYGDIQGAMQAMSSAVEAASARDVAGSFIALDRLTQTGDVSQAQAYMEHNLGLAPGSIQIAPRSDGMYLLSVGGRQSRPLSPDEFASVFLGSVNLGYRRVMMEGQQELRQAALEGQFDLAQEQMRGETQLGVAYINAGARLREAQLNAQARGLEGEISETANGQIFLFRNNGEVYRWAPTQGPSTGGRNNRQEGTGTWVPAQPQAGLMP